LGEALLESGDARGATYCFARATQLGPTSAPILLRAVNFHYRIEDPPGALRYTALILRATAEYDAIVFSSLERMGVPVEQALRTGIPAERRPAQAYLHHLIAKGKAADCARVWEWAAERGLPDDNLAAEYVDFTLRNGSPQAAAEAWARHLGNRGGDYPKANLLFNGDFEAPLTRSPLDWQIEPIDGANAAVDDATAFSGRHSLKVEFAGTQNVAYRHVWQLAAAGPGIYRLQVYLKTDNITTDQGISVHVFDSEAPGRLSLLLPALAGTNDWTKQEKVFTAPPQTRLIRVELVRLASLKFDNKIRGTVWLDAVKLERKP
jgi:hypothetical protein